MEFRVPGDGVAMKLVFISHVRLFHHRPSVQVCFFFVRRGATPSLLVTHLMRLRLDYVVLFHVKKTVAR